jgi:hypothetical protein
MSGFASHWATRGNVPWYIFIFSNIICFPDSVVVPFSSLRELGWEVVNKYETVLVISMLLFLLSSKNAILSPRTRWKAQ